MIEATRLTGQLSVSPLTMPLLLGLIWVLVLLAASVWLPRLLRSRAPALPVGSAALIIVSLAIAVRLVPNLILPIGAGYDIESYHTVGGLVLQGKDVYTQPEAEKRHPYLPASLYWMALARHISDRLGVPFVRVVRLAPILADAAIAGVLALGLRRSSSPSAAWQGGLLYAVHPIPVLISAYHGQFGSVPALCILLSWYAATASAATSGAVAAGAWLGTGILSKSWPVLALPSLLSNVRGRRNQALFVALSVLVPLVATGAYAVAFDANVWTVFRRALSYNWGIGIWGYTYLLRLAALRWARVVPLYVWWIGSGRYVTLIALGIVYLLSARKQSSAASLLTLFVGFLACTHAFSIQYLMWIVPLAILVGDQKWLLRYTLAALSYMVLAYMTLILNLRITQLLPWPQADLYLIIPAGLPAWLVTIGWLRARWMSDDEPI